MHIHWHRFIARKGINRYYECRCFARKVKIGRPGYSPVDHLWLQGYDWTKPPTRGPRGPAGESRAR